MEDSCTLDGNSNSCGLAAQTHYSGAAGLVDKSKAETYFREACDLGLAGACGILGNLYHIGDGVERNDNLSLSYYNKACQLGIKQACEEAENVKISIALQPENLKQFRADNTLGLKLAIGTALNKIETDCNQWRLTLTDPVQYPPASSQSLYQACTNFIRTVLDRTTKELDSDDWEMSSDDEAMNTLYLLRGYALTSHAGMLTELDPKYYPTVKMPETRANNHILVCEHLSQAKQDLDKAAMLQKSIFDPDYKKGEALFKKVKAKSGC